MTMVLYHVLLIHMEEEIKKDLKDSESEAEYLRGGSHNCYDNPMDAVAELFYGSSRRLARAISIGTEPPSIPMLMDIGKRSEKSDVSAAPSKKRRGCSDTSADRQENPFHGYSQRALTYDDSGIGKCLAAVSMDTPLYVLIARVPNAEMDLLEVARACLLVVCAPLAASATFTSPLAQADPTWRQLPPSKSGHPAKGATHVGPWKLKWLSLARVELKAECPSASCFDSSSILPLRDSDTACF